MIELNITNTQRVRFVANPTTLAGAPATLDGAIDATFSSGSASPGNTPLEVLVTPDVGFVGDIIGTIDGDADLGEGVETISEAYVLHVSSERAANLGVSATVEPR